MRKSAEKHLVFQFEQLRSGRSNIEIYCGARWSSANPEPELNMRPLVLELVKAMNTAGCRSNDRWVGWDPHGGGEDLRLLMEYAESPADFVNRRIEGTLQFIRNWSSRVREGNEALAKEHVR